MHDTVSEWPSAAKRHFRGGYRCVIASVGSAAPSSRGMPNLCCQQQCPMDYAPRTERPALAHVADASHPHRGRWVCVLGGISDAFCAGSSVPLVRRIQIGGLPTNRRPLGAALSEERSHGAGRRHGLDPLRSGERVEQSDQTFSLESGTSNSSANFSVADTAASAERSASQPMPRGHLLVASSKAVLRAAQSEERAGRLSR